MKRLGCLFLVMILAATTASALAEQFTLHSGVMFGMTKDEVQQIEKDAGFDVEEIEMKEEDRRNCAKIHLAEAISVNGQIAGVHGANIKYHFDKEGALDSAVYLLGIEESSGAYTPIRKSLIQKYGEPDSDMAEVWHAYLNMDAYSNYDNYGDEDVCDVDFYNNDSWLIPQEDGTYVIITGLEYQLDIRYYGSVVMTQVGYQRFGGEDIENALQMVEDSVETYNSQLENDL